jgi:hypothetical protein
MLAWRDRIAIWGFERRKAKARKGLQREIQAAKQRGEKMPAQQIQDGEYEIHCAYDGSIEAIKTLSLIRQANKLGLDTPWLDPASEDCHYADMTGDVYLTREAFRKLKDAIREEKRKRFEDWSRWIALITALTALIGTIGTLVGLVASIKRH